VGETLGGLDYWTGLLDWNTEMAKTAVKSLLESSYSLSHFTTLLHALLRRPALQSRESKVTA